ncbi:MAG: CDGSH iron-sulfur domain-containing protein [Rhodospirillaceae bacterium]|nr:CDGSH iron-sulfur domain-containing protein [Rhodospirillaceae bacterium]
MTEPVVAQKKPYNVEVEAGEDYYWCSCGKSAKQPFCDGSHKGTGMTPQQYSATTSELVHFCGCKYSANKPVCDGSHKDL